MTCLALALALVPQALGGSSGDLAPGAPSGLRAFLLRADEPVIHEYSRTPSFSWLPVPERGGHYQFQLATSPKFGDSSLVFIDNKVPFAAETIQRQLPWMTGEPYALWAHVRWVSDNQATQATRWSAPFGFNMRWGNVPTQLPAPEGLVRWTPVDGATGYEVLYPDLTPAQSFQTTTNVADEREFFTFHNALGYGTIHWRVRAIRNLGTKQPDQATNGLPAVSYGPWTPVFSTVNDPQTDGTLAPTDTVSDNWDKVGAKPVAHNLTPGYTWAPSAPIVGPGAVDPGSSLYRVYIFSDKDCVNRIFTGSIVGSPSWAPRTIGGPMPLPADTKALGDAQAAPPYLTGAGAEGNVFDAAGAVVKSNEAPGTSVGATPSTGSPASSAPSSGGSTGAAAAKVAGVDLWDSGWPSGRFYWTVVPVKIVPGPAPPAAPGTVPVVPISYHDTAIPQDACQAGDSMSFGKVSQPVVTAAGVPFVSGVAPSGREIAAAGKKAAVYSQPIVAWQPSVGATKYQVEVSRTLYPWHGVRRETTPATSIVLPLATTDAGTWYYRVRSINDSLPTGARATSWSAPLSVRITGNRISILK